MTKSDLPEKKRFRPNAVAAWGVGLIILLVVGIIAQALPDEWLGHYLWAVRVMVWVLCIFVYLRFMSKLGPALTASILHLVSPARPVDKDGQSGNQGGSNVDDKREDGAAGDDGTKRIASTISHSVTFGVTLVVLLFLFDYFGHMSIDTKPTADAAPSVHWIVNAVFNSIHDFFRQSGPRLGTFGDFFGGVVNPLLTFGTLVGLAVTIVMQRIQIREARAEAIQSRASAHTQAFETTFFHLLNLHVENIKNLEFDPTLISTGPAAEESRRLMKYHNSTTHTWTSIPPVVHGRAVFREVLDSTKRGREDKQTQLDVYRKLQREHNEVLGHYFRHLYQILNLVNSFAAEGTKAEKYKARKRYTSIVRAQMSAHELAVLLLNCTTGTVDTGKFRNLLIWWKFLEHLPINEQDGKLFARDIDADSQWIVPHYFDPAKKGLERSGAFGNHPVVAAYLERQPDGQTFDGPDNVPNKKRPA